MYPAISDHLLKSETHVPTSSTVKTVLSLSNKHVKSSTLRTSSAISTKGMDTTVKVSAITDIPRGVTSEDINVEVLVEGKPSHYQNIAICLSEGGRLKAVNNDNRWILDVRFADDCHSYNILLQRGNTKSTVLVQVVKPLRIGEELQMWLSEQLLAAMAIPFLTPLNIQGEKRYICHRCGRHFEIPNPLKFHLALDCDRLSKLHLWTRLSCQLSNKQEEDYRTEQNVSITTGLQVTPPTIGFKFELKDCKKNLSNSSKPQDLSTTSNLNNNSNSGTSSHSNDEGLHNRRSYTVRHAIRPISEPLNIRGSAFKPYWNKRSSSTNADNSTLDSTSSRASAISIFPSLSPALLSQSHFLFHPSSQLSATNVQVTKSSPVSGLLNTSSILVQSGYHKHNIMPTINVPQQQRPEATSTELGHAAEMETLVSNLGRSKQGHLCIYCGKIYSRKYGLKIHIRTHTGYKPLKCKYCLRPFGDPSNLNKHVRLHAEGDTPYKCELCGKILVRRRDLERHVKSRHSPHLDTTQEQQADKNPNS